MERFAYDVCVNVLEKFGIFKAPDDTRKQNKYLSYDFLPWISRSVVMHVILIRDSFKNVLEDKYRNDDSGDKEKIWNFFDEYLLKNHVFKARDCTGKMCMSLALCTEYIQFAATKHFAVSLNKIVIKWNNFFEKNLMQDFEAEGGFIKIYSNLKSSRIDRLDDLIKSCISEDLLLYGAREGTAELVRTCAENNDIPLDINFSIKTTGEECETDKKSSPSDPASSKKLKQEKNDSDDSRSISMSEVSDSEMSQGTESETSNSEISQNKLLGIPPHEEMLREIDPFFVENIPSPPKPQEHKPGTSDPQPSSSKSPEELTEMVEQILSKLEEDMDNLRTLLFEYGLLSMKSGRRGSKMRCKDLKGKKTPRGPEGLI
ncbi:hypothetical protein HNY73_019148 [Argiope bruennichi]|uniref:Uncharacterized protein n=1 Tax=Argiope bruennichi TaxID=94029 RepID=A0A8T0EGN6_ARGBR|nr:hypothetical protein HNY73_019148 [Argiope bruennichi]